MALTLAQLTEQLNQELYTPRTDEQLRTEAENRYKSQYNKMNLAAKQATETKDLAYQRQLKALEDALAVNQQSLIKDTADSLASANRYQVTRGMQRSSYGAANAARIQNVGQNNLTSLLKQYDTDRGDIETNRTLLAGQLAETLAQYDIDMVSDINKYIDEQKQLDYEREQAAIKNKNDILMALYEYGQAAAKKSGGGGSSRRSYSSGGATTQTDAGNTSSLWDDLNSSSAAAGAAALKKVASTASSVASSAASKVANTLSNIFKSNKNSSTKKTSTTQDGSKYRF